MHQFFAFFTIISWVIIIIKSINSKTKGSKDMVILSATTPKRGGNSKNPIYAHAI